VWTVSALAAGSFARPGSGG